MTAFQTTTADVVRPLLPDLEEAGASARRLGLSPEDEHGTGNTPALRQILAVVQIIDRRSRAIVLARRVDHLGVAKCRAVSGDRIGRKREARRGPGPEQPLH